MSGAIEYGKALFLITEEDGTTEKVMGDVKIAREAFVSNPDYAKLLDTPALTKDERTSLVDKAFAGLDESLTNLIKIITEKF
jgi:F0F1-type ATP synthase delta subunit